MKIKSAEYLADADRDVAADIPAELSPSRPSTGTVDDDDGPEDEHDGENEANGPRMPDDAESADESERDREELSDLSPRSRTTSS